MHNHVKQQRTWGVATSSFGKASLFAAIAALSAALKADTVAWYHFDEVAPGTRLVSGDEVLNAVGPASLKGTPYSVGNPDVHHYDTLGNIAEFMPTASNDVADTVYVVDPVGGTTNRNERSLFFTYGDDTAYNKPARYGGCVQVASDASLSLENVTVEFFVRPVRSTSSADGMQFVAKQSSGAQKFTYSICMTASGRPYVNVYDSSDNLMNTTGNSKFYASQSLLDGHWHHIAFTVDGTDAKLYMDYTLAASTNLTETLSYNDAAPLYIGASQMGYYMPGGFIDEVRISNGALEPSSFLRLHDTNPTCFHVGFEGTVNAELPHVVGSPSAGTAVRVNSGAPYPAFTNDVPVVRLSNGQGEVLRKRNDSSVYLAGGRVQYQHIDALEMPEVTIECFVKYIAADNYANILRLNKSNNNWTAKPIWSLGFSDGKLHVWVNTMGSNQGKQFGNAVLDGNWHHVAVTIAEREEGITVKLYDNYKQIGDPWNVTGHLDYSQGSCLGLGLSSTYDAIFHGFVDEVRISRGVLTVKEFMREGRGGTIIVVR